MAGSVFACGDGTGRPAAIRFITRACRARSFSLDPKLDFGETYMDGSAVVEHGPSPTCLRSCLGTPPRQPPSWAQPRWLARYPIARVEAVQSAGRARRNVAHHYDLDGELYALFLDADRQYSAAPISRPPISRSRTRSSPRSGISRRSCCIEPGQRVLDIGSRLGRAWRSISPRSAGARVTGITLSQEQLALARERAPAKRHGRARSSSGSGLPRHCRNVRPHRLGRHVRACRRRLSTTPFSANAPTLLDDDGVMLLHTIGRSEGPGVTNPWIAKYIFPGGYIPALSEVLPAIERAGLLVTDVEILRLHYAETLRPGASASSPIASRPSGSTTSASAHVGVLPGRPRRWRSASRRMMVFQIQLTKQQGHRADHPRLYRARGGAAARARRRRQRRRCGLPANKPRPHAATVKRALHGQAHP